MTTLEIIVTLVRENGGRDGFIPIVVSSDLKAEVRFNLKAGFFGMTGVCYLWIMEARDNYDEDRLRIDLIKSSRWEFEVYSEPEVDRRNIQRIDIIDPTGFLKWLAPELDFIDLINKQNANNEIAQPLRLSAPDPSRR